MAMEEMYENNPKKRKFTCDFCGDFVVLDVPQYPTRVCGWANISMTEYVKRVIHCCSGCIIAIAKIFPSFKDLLTISLQEWQEEQACCANATAAAAAELKAKEKPDTRKFALASRPR